MDETAREEGKMGVEHKDATLKTVAEGTALVRLATLLKVDVDHDVIEPGFFPTTPITVSIQPFHDHRHHSLGHAKCWESTATGEILSELVFNDTDAAHQHWKALKWDAEHPPSVQEFSWAFRPRPGSERRGHLDGYGPVRRLGKAADGSPGVDLVEAGPVLRGASVNSGTLAVRAAPLPYDFTLIQALIDLDELEQKINWEHNKEAVAPLRRRLRKAGLYV